MLDYYKSLEKHLHEFGYLIVEANQKDLILNIRSKILTELKRITGISEITLENYHDYFQDDKVHYKTQLELTSFFRNSNFNLEIMESNLDFFRFILGPDLDLQMQPYLRMARPGKTQDNIGYHRDTYYGTAASELSVFVPFVDLSSKNCLSIYPESHIIQDAFFETESIQSVDVKKGSDRNKIGFLYAPNVIKTDINDKMQPIPLKLGQILIFMLSTIHGSVINNSLITRWSTDIRIKNHFYSLNETMKENYYKSFKRSAVFSCNEQYSKEMV